MSTTDFGLNTGLDLLCVSFLRFQTGVTSTAVILDGNVLRSGKRPVRTFKYFQINRDSDEIQMFDNFFKKT